MSRPRLLDRLDRGVGSRLTLVSAPAGFGKTTLLAEWIATRRADGRPVAWLSLDQSDDQPSTFWTYVIAALQTVAPEAGAGALALLQSGRPAPAEAIVPALLNDLAATSNDIVLVLDDYHLIEARPIHEGVAFLLDHLPPNLHVVITGRADPPLPLARLRARGELTEVRAADLRFTDDEAAAFLNDAMGLDLTPADVAVLDGRTEGWIAGLQLAALSMQGRDDVAGLIAAFSGDDRYIVDYLVEEVLERQPDEVRQFLLRTSILDRLTGPLCDAVAGRAGGRAMLEDLERRNLFVVPLDDRRQWYRYHHLFADVLQAHLLEEQRDLVPELHGRASEWYRQAGDLAAAIRHALAGTDFGRAAALIELAVPEMRRGRRETTLRGWLEALPDEVLELRPVLNVAYAGVLLTAGELERVEPRLRAAELHLGSVAMLPMTSGAASDGPGFVDEEQLRGAPGMIAIFRAGLAQVRGDLTETERHARLALELIPEDDDLGRGAAEALLGLALWSRGDLEAAHRTFAAGIARVQTAGFVPDVIASSISLAEMRIAQGRLQDAVETYERLLRFAAEQEGPVPAGTADLHVGLSELSRERNDLEGARRHLASSIELGEGAALPEHRYRRYVAEAGMRTAEGDLDGAIELLREAERLYAGGFAPDVRPIGALRANVWIAQGRLAQASDWARERALTADDEPTYRREFEHLTLARLLIARRQRDRRERSADDALRLLDGLLQAADAAGRTGSVIQILGLQALAHEAVGDVAAALVPLGRALALAEPEGYVRVFVDEGAGMRDLLRHAAAAGIGGGYTRRLLATFEEETTVLVTGPPRVGVDGLTEPLTPREIEILRLIATGMRNQEIAEHLVISVATVKRHIANAYGKLGVSHRTEAVARATELALL